MVKRSCDTKMIIKQGNILSHESLKYFNAICFTSNGVIKNNGALVMGAGAAKAFRDKFIGLDKRAGKYVRENGNICQQIKSLTGMEYNWYTSIISFPTKHHWKNPSDIKLIEKSAHELMALIDFHKWKNVALTKPGCNNGKLNWNDVKAVLDPIFDNRITIMYL